MGVIYGPCAKCGYQTNCKRTYTKHLTRVTDCTQQRDTEWLRNDLRAMVDKFNDLVAEFQEMGKDDGKPLKVGQYKQLYARIVSAGYQLRWRFPILDSEQLPAVVIQNRLDSQLMELKQEYKARLELDAAHCAVRGVVGNKAIGCGRAAVVTPPVLDEEDDAAFDDGASSPRA